MKLLIVRYLGLSEIDEPFSSAAPADNPTQPPFVAAGAAAAATACAGRTAGEGQPRRVRAHRGPRRAARAALPHRSQGVLQAGFAARVEAV